MKAMATPMKVLTAIAAVSNGDGTFTIAPKVADDYTLSRVVDFIECNPTMIARLDDPVMFPWSHVVRVSQYDLFDTWNKRIFLVEAALPMTTVILRPCPFCYRRYVSIQRHVETGGCPELDYRWLHGRAIAHARSQLVALGLDNLAPALGLGRHAEEGEEE